MTVIIQNYSCGTVDIVDYTESEDIEIWLNRNYRLQDINYMCCDNLKISFFNSKDINNGNSNS